MDFMRKPGTPVIAGQEVALEFKLETSWNEPQGNYQFRIIDKNGRAVPIDGKNVVTKWMAAGKNFEPRVLFDEPGEYRVQSQAPRSKWYLLDKIVVKGREEAPVVRVALEPNAAPDSGHSQLWDFISDVTENLAYPKFAAFATTKTRKFGSFPPYGALNYQNLHDISTEFVTRGALGNKFNMRGGKGPAWEPAEYRHQALNMSYVNGETEDLAAPFPPAHRDHPNAVIPNKPYPLKLVPFVELIYVYWLEEGMLFQSLNRILARFQNRRAPGTNDPLSRLAVSPLLPLRGILWGLAEAEKDRLSLRRRAAEYEYQYGLQLIGRAVPPPELLVERRTQFLDAFHSLLNACHHFYKEHNDKTVDADAFPLLSNLRELHLVLAHGANNQFADASLAARIETLDVQWMLAQPEMREFLGGRTMVPYDEAWMDRVDAMKSMQGWADASVTHFYDLAVHGEQLLLSVRHGQWNSSGTLGMKDTDAKKWAINWKTSVQRYIHAYRAVTGVDLSERVDTTMPSTLLQRRLAQKLVRY